MVQAIIAENIGKGHTKAMITDLRSPHYHEMVPFRGKGLLPGDVVDLPVR